MSSLQTFLDLIRTSPELVEFEQTMSVIADNYQYQPTQFSNGVGDAKVVNKAGTNE